MPIVRSFQAWLRSTFSPMIQQLGYSARSNDTPEQKEKRSITVPYAGQCGHRIPR